MRTASVHKNVFLGTIQKSYPVTAVLEFQSHDRIGFTEQPQGWMILTSGTNFWVYDSVSDCHLCYLPGPIRAILHRGS